MGDADDRAGAYFSHEPPPPGAPARPGAWHDVAAIEAIGFVPGLHFRPVVGDGAMLSFATHDPGTVVPEHAHAEEQFTFVLEGEFEFTMNGETRVLRPGVVAHIPPHVPHSARTGAAPCVQVDVFVPPRRVLLDALRQEGREASGTDAPRPGGRP
jgi:quercetin dioxygenase-like cupin family protein